MDEEETTLPTLNIHLIKALRKLFPEKSPDLQDSDREIWYKAGASSVVSFLEDVYKRQNESILK